MKVLVLEDDFQMLKGAFDYLSLKYYGGELIVENYSKTQDFLDIKNADSYDKIFVDISLHRKSEQDGYSFINSLKPMLRNLQKVVIITGSDRVANKLTEQGITDIKILKKPITFVDLKTVMP